MSSNEDEKKIDRALENPKYKWRTIRGVAQETGLSPEKIQEYLVSHGDVFVQSSAISTNGERLFSTRSKYRKTTGFLTRVTSALKNRGG
jgi:hypothetical protein